MFGRKAARKKDERLRNRPWLSVAIMVVLTAGVIAALVLTVRNRTALRVVGLEWERIIEIEEFTGKRWIVTREEVAAGQSADDAVHWPDPKLTRTGTCDGCQREGKRRESYTVRLLDPMTDRGHGCELDESRWRQFRPDSRWSADFDRQSGKPRCDSLRPAQ